MGGRFVALLDGVRLALLWRRSGDWAQLFRRRGRRRGRRVRAAHDDAQVERRAAGKSRVGARRLDGHQRAAQVGATARVHCTRRTRGHCEHGWHRRGG